MLPAFSLKEHKKLKVKKAKPCDSPTFTTILWDPDGNKDFWEPEEIHAKLWPVGRSYGLADSSLESCKMMIQHDAVTDC